MTKKIGHALHLTKKSASIFACHRNSGLVTSSLSEFMACEWKCKDCLVVAQKAIAVRQANEETRRINEACRGATVADIYGGDCT